jgi:hypothetical protein
MVVQFLKKYLKHICALVIIRKIILIILASLTCLQEWKVENKQDQNVKV